VVKDIYINLIYVNYIVIIAMAQNQQFLQDFQNSMNTLNGMNQKIQDSLRQKQEFSDRLVARLRDINVRIKALAGQIGQLRANLDALQGQVTNNTGSINGKDKQIVELTQRITDLEAERKQFATQLYDIQKKNGEEQGVLQQQINNAEAQIRKLTGDNAALQNQANALTKELASRGDLQGQHAEELRKQTEEFQQQFAKQEAANKLQIDALMKMIGDADTRINALQKELQARTDEVEGHVKNINETQAKTQAEIAQLNQQIVDLRTENDDLIQRIIAATQAIRQATDNLELLTKSVPDGATEDVVNKLFDEIQKSIQNISGMLQGNTSAAAASAPALNLDEVIEIPQVGMPPIRSEVRNILQELDRKSSQSGNVQKYINALQQLREPGVTAADIAGILRRNGIDYKNNRIMGGKNSKKHRKKQKGGFRYNNHSKRRSISSKSSKSSRTSR
jgi:chromosome segregation ATPase